MLTRKKLWKYICIYILLYINLVYIIYRVEGIISHTRREFDFLFQILFSFVILTICSLLARSFVVSLCCCCCRRVALFIFLLRAVLLRDDDSGKLQLRIEKSAPNSMPPSSSSLASLGCFRFPLLLFIILFFYFTHICTFNGDGDRGAHTLCTRTQARLRNEKRRKPYEIFFFSCRCKVPLLFACFLSFFLYAFSSIIFT